MTQAPPGWYQDMESWENERYWNGERWTDAVRPKEAAEPTPVAATSPASSPVLGPAGSPVSVRILGPDGKRPPNDSSTNVKGRVAAWGSAVGGLVLAGAVTVGLYLWDQSELGDDVSSLVDGSDPGAVSNDEPCEDLADEAVRISDENAGLVQLLKVRAPEVVTDNRSSYGIPTGSEDELVLLCEGEGVWSNGMKADVRVRLTVDSDGDSWVFYRPVS